MRLGSLSQFLILIVTGYLINKSLLLAPLLTVKTCFLMSWSVQIPLYHKDLFLPMLCSSWFNVLWWHLKVIEWKRLFLWKCIYFIVLYHRAVQYQEPHVGIRFGCFPITSEWLGKIGAPPPPRSSAGSPKQYKLIFFKLAVIAYCITQKFRVHLIFA